METVEVWIRTDDMQFVKKEDDDNYEVLETSLYDDQYILQHVIIDLNDYDLEEEVRGFYDTLDEVKETYGDSWKQIVAECIAENTPCSYDDERFDSEKDLEKYLLSNYGIEVEL